MKKAQFFILILSVVHPILSFSQSATKDVLYQVGKLNSIQSSVLKEQRNYYVQLPTDYSPDKKYPVAIVLDGVQLLPTVEIVQNYYSGGFTPEMILVGVANDHNRTKDLTPTKIKEKYGMPFTEPSGAADQFLEFIETELLPDLEKKYPITNYRTLIGHSYGGLFTIHTLFQRPQLFANYIAIDPSLDWDDQYLLSVAQQKLSTERYLGKSLFVSLNGQIHMQDASITIDNVMKDTTAFTLFHRSNLAFSELVEKNKTNGLAYHWKYYPKDLHGTIPLPSMMDGLMATFEWYQMEQTHVINDFETPKRTLYNIIKYRERKLKHHFGYAVPPYPEALLNMSGYMHLEMNNTEKAKMYFEFALEYYPQSANAYDSMSEFYEKQGDISSALKFATHAHQISGNKYFESRLKELKKKL